MTARLPSLVGGINLKLLTADAMVPIGFMHGASDVADRLAGIRLESATT